MYSYLREHIEITGEKLRANPLYILYDPCQEFIYYFKERYSGDPYIDIVQGYAEYMPFRDSSIDTSISSFVMRDVIDLAKSLVNMIRVSRRRVIILDFHKPPNYFFYILELLYMYLVVPIIILITEPRLLREYLTIAYSVIIQNKINELVRVYRRKLSRRIRIKCWLRCVFYLLEIE